MTRVRACVSGGGMYPTGVRERTRRTRTVQEIGILALMSAPAAAAAGHHPTHGHVHRACSHKHPRSCHCRCNHPTHGLVHELAGDLEGLRGQGGGEHAHLQPVGGGGGGWGEISWTCGAGGVGTRPPVPPGGEGARPTAAALLPLSATWQQTSQPPEPCSQAPPGREQPLRHSCPRRLAPGGGPAQPLLHAAPPCPLLLLLHRQRPFQPCGSRQLAAAPLCCSRRRCAAPRCSRSPGLPPPPRLPPRASRWPAPPAGVPPAACMFGGTSWEWSHQNHHTDQPTSLPFPPPSPTVPPFHPHPPTSHTWILGGSSWKMS